MSVRCLLKGARISSMGLINMTQRIIELVLSQSLVSDDCWLHCYFIIALLLLLLLPSVAGTPTNVTASRTGYTSVLVSWTAPLSPPAGYEVFYQTTAAGNNTIRLSGGNTSNTELTLTGLKLGETYSILVVAFGEEGTLVLPSNHSNTAMIMLCEFMHDNSIYKQL